MNPELITEFRNVVAVLTQPHEVAVKDANGVVLGHRSELPLLTKLRAAAIPNSGSAAGGGSLPNQRVNINVGAVDLITRIGNKASAWYQDELRQIGMNDHFGAMKMEAIVTNWHFLVIRRFRGETISDSGMELRIRAIKIVISDIRGLLDPNYTFEVTAACPECHATRVSMLVNGEYLPRRALVVTETDPLELSYVNCGNCHRTWHGVDEVRALRIAIDKHEQETTDAA